MELHPIDRIAGELTADEKKELWQKQNGLTDDDFLAMDETEFRARFRERLHHTLEIQVYSSAYRKTTLPGTQADMAKRLLGLWKKRGLSKNLPDFRTAQTLIHFADELSAGKQVDLSSFIPGKVTPEERDSFFRIVRERRSVREFTRQEVSDELIDQILDAGLWAAHACNLQSIRYLVIREANAAGLFRGSDIPGGPVHIVVLQDQRVYKGNQFMTVKNHLLDAGAAAQNIVLATHAVGLAGVWLTFSEPMLIRIRDHFNLPDYIRITTYVDIGYGDQTPYPPQRNAVKDVVIARV